MIENLTTDRGDDLSQLCGVIPDEICSYLQIICKKGVGNELFIVRVSNGSIGGRELG
jgi:hypothetical protein